MDETLEHAVRLVEALVFASAEPVSTRAVAELLPEDMDAVAVLEALRARCQGRGVHLIEVAGGWQFCTATDLAPHLERVMQKPKRLPRAAMETLAIVAQFQPVTRAEIEQLRGAALGQATLDVLLELGLIKPFGRKEAPGRPTLWGTTAAFLAHFGLRSLHDLPTPLDAGLGIGRRDHASRPAAGEEPGEPPPGEGDGSARPSTAPADRERTVFRDPEAPVLN